MPGYGSQSGARDGRRSAVVPVSRASLRPRPGWGLLWPQGELSALLFEVTSHRTPLSLRLPSDLRGELQEYADEIGLKLHPVCVQLLREGLLQRRISATAAKITVQSAREN